MESHEIAVVKYLVTRKQVVIHIAIVVSSDCVRVRAFVLFFSSFAFQYDSNLEIKNRNK